VVNTEVFALTLRDGKLVRYSQQAVHPFGTP
jgi:hypothetical protein